MEPVVLDNSVVELVRSSGAMADLTSFAPDTLVAEHVHDFPYLSLHVLGSYSEQGDNAAASIDGPAASFHPAGTTHSDAIGARGLTTVVISFDPAWLAHAVDSQLLPVQSTYWLGGGAARNASVLARHCLAQGRGAAMLDAIKDFLANARRFSAGAAEPAWMWRLRQLMQESEEASPDELARALGVSAPWLARAYRAHQGEGLADTLRRLRVEKAVALLAQTQQALADIAGEAGFADQSHMNRVFQALLRRTPLQIRADRFAAKDLTLGATRVTPRPGPTPRHTPS
jgi:AraC family transcriptional regulator